MSNIRPGLLAVKLPSLIRRGGSRRLTGWCGLAVKAPFGGLGAGVTLPRRRQAGSGYRSKFFAGAFKSAGPGWAVPPLGG